MDISTTDPDMDAKIAGFCCFKIYTNEPRSILCNHTEYCIIEPYDRYFVSQNRFFYCVGCFESIEGDEVFINYNPFYHRGARIKKRFFEEKKNDVKMPEPLIECTECGRVQHAICELYYEEMQPQRFTCHFCLQKMPTKRHHNIYTSQRLLQTRLSSFIERRLRECLTDTVSIRVVSSTDQILRHSREAKDGFAKDGTVLQDMPYKCKGIFAFEQIDDVDVCIFGMYVQEYGSECPAPSTSKVYISYIDSVNYYIPRYLRTKLYYEILLGYLSYVKKLGYVSAHIWAVPKKRETHYIFNGHPKDQKVPDAKRLQEWYLKIFKIGKSRRIILEYKYLLESESKVDVTQIPYFIGDYWNTIVNDTEENEEDIQIKEAEYMNYMKKDGNAGNFLNSDVYITESERTLYNPEKDKTTKVYANGSYTEELQRYFDSLTIEDYASFTVQLNTEQTTITSIQDPDPLIFSNFANNAESFWYNCQNRQLEFSSLRKAKYATMILLYELHNQLDDRFYYSCNMCEERIETRYICRKCPWFNLCAECFMKTTHRHGMIEKTFNPQVNDFNLIDNMITNPSLVTHNKLVVETQMQFHSFHCKNSGCPFKWCLRKSREMYCACELKRKGGCNFCKLHISALLYHSKNCNRYICKMLHCEEIRLDHMVYSDAIDMAHRNQLEAKKDEQILAALGRHKV